MKFRLSVVCWLLAVANVAFADRPIFQDDYSKAKHELRSPSRGEWKIEKGIASVTQDEELYKKYKNHGPIMIYNVAHDDAMAEVTFKPNGCKAVVFTMDAKTGGHAFRVKLSPKAAGAVLTYIKEKGAEKATPVFLDKTLPKLNENEWTTLKVKVVGSEAVVMVGDKTFKVKHEKIDQAKKVAKLGFSFGSLQIKQFNLTSL